MEFDFDISHLDGMFVGMLEPYELKALDKAVKEGRAERCYEGAAGLLGLSKVRIIKQEPA